MGTYQIGSPPSSVFISRRPTDFQRLARQALRDLPMNVWLLQGPLGSGKTTFARAVLRALGYRGGVRSPTFSLVHHYRTRHRRWSGVVHIDAYRVAGVHEIAALDLPAAVANPRHLVLIEWPERLRLWRWRGVAKLNFAHRGRDRVVKYASAA